MTAITLLDGSLKLSIYFDVADREYEDDICLRFEEDCPEDEKIFKADDTTIFLTPEQAGLVVLELNRVLKARRDDGGLAGGGDG